MSEHLSHTTFNGSTVLKLNKMSYFVIFNIICTGSLVAASIIIKGVSKIKLVMVK